MERINIMEAARRCQVSDKTIRRAIANGKLSVRRPKSNVVLIDVSDLERWHQLSLDVSEQRFATMEQRLLNLEQQVQHLMTQVDELKAVRTTRPKLSPLPPDLVHLYAFISQHAVPAGEVRRLIQAGFIPTVKGPWMTAKGRIEEALDEQGRRAFWVQLHSHQDFRTCDDCPHEAST